MGQVHPRRPGQGHVDLLRRARPRGPAAPDRRSPDRPVAAHALARVPPDPQQRALPRGQEARAEDVSVERLAPAVQLLLRAEIGAAQGREVSFVGRLDGNGRIVDARVVARGTVDAVLALPGIAERGEILLHNHPSGVLDPSGADLAVAARLHDGGVGFAIVDNDVTACYVVVEVPRPRTAARLDPVDVAGLLAPRGAVARVLGAFEDRPSQRDMAAYTADVYNDGGVALLEAGTSVGKSFAYLVPALVWARENGERTVVSTNTINLQEQLVGKDLPILARAFSTGERGVTFALLKGWRNYLCLSRLEQARAGQESLFDEGRGAELESIAGWAARTADGSLSDLVEEPSNDVWDAVAAESDLCTRLKCPHFDRCFVFAAARRWAEELFGRLGRRLDTDQVLRLTDSFAADGVWREGLDVALDNLLVAFSKLRDGVETIADRLSIDDPAEMRTRLIGELRGVVRRLDAAAEGLKATLQPVGYRPAAGPAVRWMERRGRRTPNVTLSAVPLDLAPVLKEALFDRVETVVLTSATLAAGGEFTFLEERLGLALPPSRVTVREILPSPFDFGAQCVFGIPTDIPEPRDDESGHGAAVARVLLELAHASDGGIFALFTSHGALRRTADTIRGEVGARWPLLVQGEGQRDQLLRRFRDAGSAILLGTDSFWEGVDVPGRALRVLILAKLPFKVPSEPLTAARLERLTEAGVDGFTHYLVPLAALKLKQGFGRLIRTKSDVGAVVLLDRRVVTKRYGARMLEGLPPASKAIGNWPDVRRELEEFFAMHSIGTPLSWS